MWDVQRTCDSFISPPYVFTRINSSVRHRTGMPEFCQIESSRSTSASLMIITSLCKSFYITSVFCIKSREWRQFRCKYRRTPKLSHVFELGYVFCEVLSRMGNHTVELCCAENTSKTTKCELCDYMQPSLFWRKISSHSRVVLPLFYQVSLCYQYISYLIFIIYPILLTKYLKFIYSFGKRKIGTSVETVQFIFLVMNFQQLTFLNWYIHTYLQLMNYFKTIFIMWYLRYHTKINNNYRMQVFSREMNRWNSYCYHLTVISSSADGHRTVASHSWSVKSCSTRPNNEHSIANV